MTAEEERHCADPAVENPFWRIDTSAEPLSYSHMKRRTPILAFALIAVPERFAALLASFGDLPFGVWPA